MKPVIPALLFATLMMGACKSNNDNTDASQNTTTATASAPANLAYQVVNKFPHDTSYFTEGLFYQDGKMYESRGEYGTSGLNVWKLGETKPVQKINLDNKYFGEGISELNGKIYQLTYREHVVFVYDAKTLQKVGELQWPMEGWGMTTDGKNLIITTGDSNLYYVDPTTFKIVKTVGVTDNYGPVANLNEVEYVDGQIFANVWQTNQIYKIDPTTGSVKGILDLTDINTKNGVNFQPNGDAVLNGIAYKPDTKTLLVTGKNWPELYELKLQ